LAEAVESVGGPCLAHHTDRFRLISQQAAIGEIDLLEAEVDDALCVALGGNVVADGNRPIALYAPRATFVGNLKIDTAIFAPNTSFVGATFIGRATFEDATFMGSAKFGSCQFRDSATFYGATFQGEAMFIETRFRYAPSFEGATFKRYTNFDEARFREGAIFIKATFEAPASFAEAAFGFEMCFDGATFHERASFDAAFDGLISFESAHLCPFLWLHQRGSEQAVALFTGVQVPNSTAVELQGPWRITLDKLLLQAPLTITSATLAISSSRTSEERPSTIESMRDSVLLAPLVVGNGITLTDTRFLGTTGLDQLRLRGDPRWDRRHRRAILADERALAKVKSGPNEQAVSKPSTSVLANADLTPRQLSNHAQVEALYRQLRAALEQSKAAPDAADFYYGEMEMRRHRAGRLEAALLHVYKALGGYGVRAWRPLAAYFALITLTVIALLIEPIRSHLVTATVVDSLDITKPGGAIGFVLRNSTSIFSAPATELTGLGTSLFVFERYAAVSLLALFVLAVRSKVQR
jgi:hypothetical protein